MNPSSGTDKSGIEPGGADDHDKWFRAQVQEALAEADDPSAGWISNEEAMARGKAFREELLAKGKALLPAIGSGQEL